MRKHPIAGAVGAVSLGICFSWGSQAERAEELRIGFLAPTTGLFAQVGKDMVDTNALREKEAESKALRRPAGMAAKNHVRS